jgi:hypothetical protein
MIAINSDILILSKQEKKRILTLHGLFERQVEHRAEIALIYEDEHTY